MVRPVVAVLQRDGDEALAVPLGAGDQGPPGSPGVAGLEAHAVRAVAEELIVVRESPATDGDAPGGGDAEQRGVRRRGPAQLRHVEGGGVVALGVQAVGVREGGVGHPQLRRRLVHQGHEMGHVPRHRVRDGHGGVVAGGEQEAVEQGLQRQLLPRLQVHGAALHPGGVPAHGTDHAEVGAPDGDEGRHQLRGGGDAHPGVGVLAVEHPAAVCVHQDGGDGGSADSRRLTRENA